MIETMDKFYEKLIYSSDDEKERIRKSFEEDILKNRSDEISEALENQMISYFYGGLSIADICKK